MKRLLVMLFAIALCFACVPSPDEPAVTGRAPIGQERAEDAPTLAATASETPAPSTWEECVAVDKGALTEIRFAAALENMDVREAAIYPLTPVSFDAETIDRLLAAFSPDARIAIGLGSMTLQDVEQEIAQTLQHIDSAGEKAFDSEADRAQYLSEENEYLAELKQLYRELQQQTAAFVDANALAERERADFSLIDASDRTVARGRLTCGIEAGDPRASLFRLQRKEEENPTELAEPDEETVRPVCEAFLQAAGVEGFSFSEIASAREVVYTRSLSELPYSAAYGITALQWRDYDDGELFSEPAWMDESIAFFVRDGRVANVSWRSKSEIGEAIRTVPVLPLSDLIRRTVNGLTFQWSMPLDEAEASQRIEVRRMQLGYKRVPVYGAVRQYQLIPVCTVIGRIVQKYRSPADNPQIILDAENEWYGGDGVLLVLSAIDGSIVG